MPIDSPSARANPALLPPDPGEITRRAHLLLSALARSGLAAFTPGERDLAMGPPLLRQLLAEHKIPALAANLYDDRGRLFFEADRVVEVAGVKIGLFGLIRALPEDAERWKAWRLDARDPSAAARDEVVALHGRGAEIVIAMVHAGPYAEAQKIMKDAPGIDWVVLGHSGMNFETPDEYAGSRALEAMTMGKDFGRLDLHVVNGKPGPFIDRGRRAQLLAILEDHQHQISDYQKRAPDQPPTLRAYFADQIAKLEKAIAHDRDQLRTNPAEIRGNWFENRIVPLAAAIPDHPGVALLVAAYNRESQRRAAAGLPVGVTPHLPTSPHPIAAATEKNAGAAPPDENLRYAGTVACGGCHAQALKFWQTTAHARAFATLKKAKRDGDPTCVGCHVTGYMRPGGTGDLRVATARLRDVGCEACHGPGLEHVTAQSGNNVGGRAAAKPAETQRQGAGGFGNSPGVPITKSVCLGCHTPDQTNGDFDYAHYLKAILGPGHGGV